MKTRIIAAAVLLPIFFAILFIFPPIVLTILVSIISALAASELLYATKNEKKRIRIYTLISAAFVPIAVYLSTLPMYAPDPTTAENASINAPRDPYSALILITLLMTIVFFLLCMLIIEAVLAFRTEKQIKIRQILISLAAGLLIPYALSSLISLKTMPYGHLLVLLPIVSTMLTDSGAYFTGIAIGKRKPFPTISPNKTVEGYIGGIITGTIGMMIYGIILSYATPLFIMYPALILYGILGAIVTELGDLLFSYIKRKCEIKDYSRLIPGHGGVLDRFDSMILNAPLMYLLVTTLPALAT